MEKVLLVDGANARSLFRYTAASRRCFSLGIVGFKRGTTRVGGSGTRGLLYQK